MKNKKILAIGLCGAICLSIAGVTYASALASDTPKVSTSETGNTSSADILYQDTDGGQISVHLCFHYIRKFTIPTFHNFYIILDIFTFRDAICKIAIICQKFTRSIRHRR